jgi:hypothetical protein
MIRRLWTITCYIYSIFHSLVLSNCIYISQFVRNVLTQAIEQWTIEINLQIIIIGIRISETLRLKLRFIFRFIAAINKSVTRLNSNTRLIDYIWTQLPIVHDVLNWLVIWNNRVGTDLYVDSFLLIYYLETSWLKGNAKTLYLFYDWFYFIIYYDSRLV